MKKFFFSFKLFAVITLMVLGCIGCGQNTSESMDLAVVYGSRSNEPNIPITTAPTVKNAIFKTCYAYGKVSFVRCDGIPKVVYQTAVPDPEIKGLSESKKKSIANGYTDQLLEELAKIYSLEPEADTLQAIQYGAMTLCDSTADEKVLLIIDNGLSTKGYLDFTANLLYADTEEILTALNEAEAIPDLKGVHVLWMYLGQTVAPQEELSEAQKHKLEEIWTAILKAGGAECVDFATDVASDMSENTMPPVSTVDVEERRINVTATEPMDTVVLDNTSIQFLGDKAEFVNEEVAINAISEYAKILLQQPNRQVYIIGTTAGGDREFCKKLSEARAAAVKSVLISCGVSEEQLICLGLGCSDPWHISDVDENGRQVEEYASKNRKVLLMDVSSEEAKLISVGSE